MIKYYVKKDVCGLENRAALHARGKVYVDKLLGTGMKAKQALAQYGSDQVIDATMGVIMDDQGKLVCLPTVETQLRNLPIEEIIGYSPVGGLPGYLEACIRHTFGEYRPDAYIRAVASAGGAGAISNVLWNYTNGGDTVLTHDWYWTPYKTICSETGRHLETFNLLDEKMKFNLSSFGNKVKELLKKQDHLVIILNSPSHNPTGYSIADNEWDEIISLILEEAKDSTKTITLAIDIAYIDFTEDPVAARSFMQKFGGLPANVVVTFAFSMSKGFTAYGQRTGAVIGVSSNKDVIEEFANVMLVTSRSRWSNVNRGCMNVLANIYQDEELLKQVDDERDVYRRLIAERADAFLKEAEQIGLTVLPYHGGFFITIPCDHPDQVSDVLIEDKIFVASLQKGIRVAVCSVPVKHMKRLATKLKEAIAESNA